MKYVLFFLMSLSATQAATLIRKIKDPKTEAISILSIDKIKKKIMKKEIILQETPMYLFEDQAPSKEIYQEVLVRNEDISFQEEDFSKKFPNSEVRLIKNQGPDSNRINLTFLGDGYTLEEKEKFFEDAQYLVNNMFIGQTFKSYLPLFNIYAVFTASKESGISDLKRKDTVFGLYRSPKGSKRGIMPGNTRKLEQALKLTNKPTHYPVVIANDDYYGGLGGRYAITTRSRKSGAMVLRHELGHNFGNVGEEYDGGHVYRGANSSSAQKLKWPEWIAGPIKRHKARHLLGAYIWQDLKKPFSSSFQLASQDQNKEPFKYEVKMSSVGWSTAEDVSIKIDNQEYNIRGTFTPDRSFFYLKDLELDSGKHKLEIKNKSDSDNILAYARVYAYPSSYDFTPDKVMAFATYDSDEDLVGYRPTHDICLMRNMESKNFCPVDIQNMWIKFLSRINLIDEVTHSNNKTFLATLNIPLQIKWFKVEGKKLVEITQLRGKKKANSLAPGKYKIEVTFKSDEVRTYNSNMKDEVIFTRN